MPRRIDIPIAESVSPHWNGTGTNYLVLANNGHLYLIYIASNNDVLFRKSTNNGLTWQTPVQLLATGTATNLAIWYDRWSNYNADYIHVASVDSATDDTTYRTINTASSDALSTQTNIQNTLTSQAAGGHISVVRSVGGDVYCKAVIDAGTEGTFYRLVVANFPNGAWATATVDEAIATLDQMILLPDFDAADPLDILAIFQDASVTETSRKLFDASANSWSETSINAAITELNTATGFPNLAAAPDIANTRHVLLVWTNTDTVNADLLCYTIDSGAITAKTDVVTNSGDDQGLCAIGIATDTGYWHAFYCGKSDGSETWNTSLNVYTKISKDSGTTWGPETLVSTSADTIRWLTTIPRFTGKPVVAWFRDGAVIDEIFVSVEITLPKAQLMLGV